MAHISGILDPFSFFLYVYVYKCSVQGQNGSVIRNVHLSSGPFKWSALYIRPPTGYILGLASGYSGVLYKAMYRLYTGVSKWL